MTRFPLLNITFLLNLSLSAAMAQKWTTECVQMHNFLFYNATRSHSIPAFTPARSTSNPSISEVVQSTTDPKFWSISARVFRLPYAHLNITHDVVEEMSPVYISQLYIDTSHSDTSRIGMCHEGLVTHEPIFGSGGGGYRYLFTREVLERSVGDMGDCKVMLGVACVDALKRRGVEQAKKDMEKGRCGINQDWDRRVPKECRGLLSGDEGVDAGFEPLWKNFRADVDLASSFPSESSSCPLDTQTLNDNDVHIGAGFGGLYNQTIRFPTPTILTFWPRVDHFSPDSKPRATASDALGKDTGVHVEIMCLRPDEVVRGSAMPPSVEELLKRDDVTFDKRIKKEEAEWIKRKAEAEIRREL